MNESSKLAEEFLDSLDEELELSLEDLSFDLAIDLSPEQHQARRNYFTHLFALQRELVKLQEWVVATGHKLVVIFEGRDAAGKGGAIKRITQRLNPRVCRVAIVSTTAESAHRWHVMRLKSGLRSAVSSAISEFVRLMRRSCGFSRQRKGAAQGATPIHEVF